MCNTFTGVSYNVLAVLQASGFLPRFAPPLLTISQGAEQGKIQAFCLPSAHPLLSALESLFSHKKHKLDLAVVTPFLANF